MKTHRTKIISNFVIRYYGEQSVTRGLSVEGKGKEAADQNKWR